MPPTKTWKSIERRIAARLGTRRTPLSGGNSGHTRSDTLHERVFAEIKYRKQHSAVNLWRNTAELAEKEGKLPVVALAEKGKRGFWWVVRDEDIEELVKELVEIEKTAGKEVQVPIL